MSNSSVPLPSDSSDTSLKIQQDLKGDRNQVIGQAVSSTIVNVTGGGQVTIYQSQLEQSFQVTPQTPGAAIGSNPYKGLLAFQGADRDYFFGREKQIGQLWQKLRILQEQEAIIRILPIYGPSGSGKSSLARAGLIPELARRPLPGREKARVAILVPGTHPVEALATVLARIATDDPTPVSKTREFTTELSQSNQAGEYDGLRRIAAVLPNIGSSPLIVLVDQAEEVNTLCTDPEERKAFVRNLIYAASDRSKQVSVIVILRSDFLGETQKYPILNRLFSEQGYLVPVLNEAELRQAIRKPAELAGHPLDDATISLLIEQTEGRQGTLPLLQFTLTRIWEGLLEGIAPAITLEQIGGVGGALAGEAQRVYDSLTPQEQTISRRVFLGLVQLGEGIRDTRRRVSIEDLVTCKDNLEQVKQVVSRFAEPGARLITCAGSGTMETAEVTHEALFDHWNLLIQWLDQSRNNLRFQRRLEDAAKHWEAHNRSAGTLWRPPDLDLLERFYKEDSYDMTPLQIQFFRACQQSEINRKRLQQLTISGLVGGLILTTGFGILAIYQLQQAQRQKVEQLSATAEALLATQPVNALINAIGAIGLEQSVFVQFPNHWASNSAYESLLKAVWVNRERNLLPSHDEVNSVAFSPDGKIIATGSRDKTIRLWNATKGQPIGHPLMGHEDEIYSLAFSPDGKMIASGSWDRTVRLWDTVTGQPIGKPLRGHKDQVYSVAFSPDGKMIASGSRDKTIRLWETFTGKPIGEPVRGHQSPVVSVAFSPDGKILASGSWDRTVRLWSTTTRQPIGQPLEHAGAAVSVAFSPDGKILACGTSDDRAIRLWNVVTRQPIGQPLRGHNDSVTSVIFSLSGDAIISGSVDRTIRLWDIKTGKPKGKPLTGHEDDIKSLALSPNGNTIVSSSVDKTVRLWDTQKGQVVGKPLEGHEDEVKYVAFSPDGKVIASGSRDTTVRLWDVKTGELLAPPLRGHSSTVFSIAFSPNGKIIASGSRDRSIRLWDARTGRLIGQPLQGHDDVIYSVAFSSDGQTIVSGSADKTIRLWSAHTRQLIGQPLRGHTDEVYAVAFNPDGEMIVSGGRDKTIRLWDSKTEQPIGQPLRGHENEIWDLTFSPDGKTIASASLDRTIRLWDVKTGQPIGQPLRGHEDEVWTVAFSPDGKMLASAGKDKTIRLWDVKTRQPIGQPLRGHEEPVFSVAFSPDGQFLASGSGDKTVRMWAVAWVTSWQSLLQVACRQLRYHPNLTHPTNSIATTAKQTCERYGW